MYKFCEDITKFDYNILVFCLIKARKDLELGEVNNVDLLINAISDLKNFLNPNLDEDYRRKIKEFNNFIMQYEVAPTQLKKLKILNEEVKHLINALSLRECFNANLNKYANKDDAQTGMEDGYCLLANYNGRTVQLDGEIVFSTDYATYNSYIKKIDELLIDYTNLTNKVQ